MQILQQRGHPCPIDTFLVLSITVEYNIRMARVTIYSFALCSSKYVIFGFVRICEFCNSSGCPLDTFLVLSISVEYFIRMSWVTIYMLAVLYLQIIPDSSVDREELLTMISKLMQYPHKGE